MSAPTVGSAWTLLTHLNHLLAAPSPSEWQLSDRLLQEICSASMQTDHFLTKDIELLTSCLKYMIQHWDDTSKSKASNTVGNAHLLCYHLAGALCIAVSQFGDEISIVKAIRNCQFPISKALKSEQCWEIWFMLSNAVAMVKQNTELVLADGVSCGKSIALLSQSIANFCTKCSSPALVSRCIYPETITSQANITQLLKFCLDPAMVGVMQSGLPGPAVCQILVYVIDSCLLFAVSQEQSLDQGGQEKTNACSISPVLRIDDKQDVFDMIAGYLAHNSAIFISNKFLDWAIKRSKLTGSCLLEASRADLSVAIYMSRLHATIVPIAKSPVVRLEEICLSISAFCLNLSLDVTSNGMSNNGAGKLDAYSSSSITDIWSQLLDVLSASDLSASSAYWTLMENINLTIGAVAFPHIIRNQKRHDKSAQSIDKASLSWMDCFYDLFLETLTSDALGLLPSEYLSSVLAVAIRHCKHFYKDLPKVFVRIESFIAADRALKTANALSVAFDKLFKIFSFSFKLLSTSLTGLCASDDSCESIAMIAIYNEFLHFGYTMTSAGLASMNELGQSSESSLSTVSSALGRWKGMVSFALSRAPPAAYSFIRVRRNIMSGIKLVLKAEQHNDSNISIFSDGELCTLVIAAASRKSAWLYCNDNSEPTRDLDTVCSMISERLCDLVRAAAPNDSANIKKIKAGSAKCTERTLKRTDMFVHKRSRVQDMEILAIIVEELSDLVDMLDAAISLNANGNYRDPAAEAITEKMLLMLTRHSLDRISLVSRMFILSGGVDEKSTTDDRQRDFNAMLRSFRVYIQTLTHPLEKVTLLDILCSLCSQSGTYMCGPSFLSDLIDQLSTPINGDVAFLLYKKVELLAAFFCGLETILTCPECDKLSSALRLIIFSRVASNAGGLISKDFVEDCHSDCSSLWRSLIENVLNETSDPESEVINTFKRKSNCKVSMIDKVGRSLSRTDCAVEIVRYCAEFELIDCLKVLSSNCEDFVFRPKVAVMELLLRSSSSSDRSTWPRMHPQLESLTADLILVLYDILALQSDFHNMVVLVRFVSNQFPELQSLPYLCIQLKIHLLFNGLKIPNIIGREKDKNWAKCEEFLGLTATLLQIENCDSICPEANIYTLSDFTNRARCDISFESFFDALNTSLLSLTGTGLVIELQNRLNNWLSLLCCKCIACVWSCFRVAIDVAKKTARWTSPNGPNINYWKLYLRIECMLLIGELYEQYGSIDRALPYLAEARSGAALIQQKKQLDNPDSLINIYNLHILRIWQRVQSKKYLELLSRWKETILEFKQRKEASVSTIVDSVSMVVAILTNDGKNVANLKKLQISSYRLVNWQYDFKWTKEDYYGPFHTALSPWTRRTLKTFLDTEVSYCDKRNNVLSTLAELSYTCKDLFDVTRALRRFGSVLAMNDSPDPFDPFFFASTSCSVSIVPNKEPEVLAQQGEELTWNSEVDARLHASSGDRCNLKLHLNDLINRYPKSTKYKNKLIVITSVIERNTNRLLLSRYDCTFGCLSVAIPSRDLIFNCLEQWEEITSDNVKQLTSTLSSDEVLSWTEHDKKVWWENRKALDVRMGQFVEDFQNLLGCWRCMFSALPDEKMLQNTNAAIENVNLEMFFERGAGSSSKGDSTKAKGRNDKKGRKSQAESKSPLMPIVPWLCLILSSMDSRVLSFPLSVNECCEALCQLLKRHTDQSPVFSPHLSGSVEDCTLSEMVMSIISEFLSLNDTEANKSLGSPLSEVPGIDYAAMNVTELKTLLKSMGLAVTGKKADLLNRLKEHSEIQSNEPIDVCGQIAPSTCSTAIRSSFVFILDEILQKLPWESIPVFRSRSCSRVPNLRMLCSLLASGDRCGDVDVVAKGIGSMDILDSDYLKNSHSEQQAPGVNGRQKLPSHMLKEKKRVVRPANERTAESTDYSNKNGLTDKVWFCIDPECNLPRTRDTMSTFLSPLAEEYGWKGVIGTIPCEREFRVNHETSSLFIYSGHGGGEKLMPASSFKLLSSCPSALLWGCSSGKLHPQGIHDPSGVSSAYLSSGASFVVGNLWDVTDVDIDKLSMNCMSSLLSFDVHDKANSKGRFQDEASDDIGIVLQNARSVCKLKCAVGFSPVIYGIPELSF